LVARYINGSVTFNNHKNIVLEYAIDTLGTEGNWIGSDALPLNQSGVAATPGNLRLSDESQTVNLLTGLAPGTYVLETYALATSNIGTLYENNGGGNFGAEFIVVPGPSSLALAAVGGLGLLGTLRKRVRS
jgi:hypothetical protein